MSTSVYTEAQLGQYFDHIAFPRTVPNQAENTLDFLAELQKRNLTRVPFESVSLHYSRRRLLSLDPEDLFAKIVTNSRGGYCMEVNAFFGTVLRSLGFTLISAGARVNGRSGYKGWDHMVNIVTIDQKSYLVDVAYGSNGPYHPIPLEPDIEFNGIYPAQGKLEYKALPQHTDPKQRVWVFSSRPDADAAWKEEYAFVETEFFPGDFEIMNMMTMTAPQSLFVQTVIATRILLNQQDGEPEGVIILFKNYIKRRIRKHTEIIQTLTTEDERVGALKDYFFIELKPEEQRAIRGLPSELKTGEAEPSGLA
ncbi:cysteine proteinase [Coniochaeta ligniaria NRRL 30616]|uniref:Cysteine proteinase n=1 Tax=Coniochaeta ligniaria NRRL 30616 TaxID=1408157 RepID=A0A1J7IWF5_9PEZI|nr:cysteine proteinase [Coniochaeta ligniaria NRRL 30616]